MLTPPYGKLTVFPQAPQPVPKRIVTVGQLVLKVFDGGRA